MSTATLNGHRVTHATVHLPAWGAWHASLTLDAERTIEGSVELVLADLVLTGTVVSGGASRGRSGYRIVGGAGGWGRVVARRGYSADAGVKVATLVTDAAGDAGEPLDATTLPTTRVGPAFVRAAGPAAAVLEQVAPRAWYVGTDGVTRLGQRTGTVVAAGVPRTAIDLGHGRVELAPEQLAELTPGVTVDGIVAVDVQHELTPDGLRTTIWGAGVGATSRRLEALRALIRQLLPTYRYHAVYEYRVVTQDSERLNLQPVRVATAMPELRRVRVRPGVAGVRADVALGSHVLVTFVDGDPARPVVIGHADAEQPGFAPDRLDLVGEDDSVTAAEVSGRALRYGDTIMMPTGAAATPTATVIIANPVGISSVSRVRP